MGTDEIPTELWQATEEESIKVFTKLCYANRLEKINIEYPKERVLTDCANIQYP